jgi:hypothetical protein
MSVMQPTPSVSRADVERVVRRDFPAEACSEVLAMLDEYGSAGYHRERDRVQLAVLKLADGSRETLRREIEGAKCDYRDTLLSSEYPGYGKKMFHIDKATEEERQRVIDADWKQYWDWLVR